MKKIKLFNVSRRGVLDQYVSLEFVGNPSFNTAMAFYPPRDYVFLGCRIDGSEFSEYFVNELNEFIQLKPDDNIRIAEAWYNSVFEKALLEKDVRQIEGKTEKKERRL